MMDEDGRPSSSLSQDTHSSILFMNKSHSDASYGPTTGGTPVRWQTEHKEFQFNCNSTPFKGGRNIVEDPARKLLRKRRVARNRLSGAKPRLPSNLAESATKLDLLDDQIMTSLPIPPPVHDHSELHENHVNEFQIRVHTDNRRISIAPKHRALQEQSSRYPVVLVEDYIPQSSSGLHFARSKVSVSDLKSKISKNKSSRLPIKLKSKRSASTASSLTLTPHINDEDSFGNMDLIDENLESSGLDFDQHTTSTGATVSADVEQLLSDVIKPTVDSVKDQYLHSFKIEQRIKGCVICEKPLYEISTLLEGRHFREVVCSNCTLKYEETAKILEDYEFETSTDTINDSRDVSLESEDLLDETEQIVPVAKKRLKTSQFSSHLINRLHLQLQNNPEADLSYHNQTVDSKTMMWFIEAKRKLRWKWRVNGLLPQFLAGKRNV